MTQTMNANANEFIPCTRPKLVRENYTNDLVKTFFWVDYLLEESYSYEEAPEDDQKNEETFGFLDLWDPCTSYYSPNAVYILMD